jgi:hypothetical protein
MKAHVWQVTVAAAILVGAASVASAQPNTDPFLIDHIVDKTNSPTTNSGVAGVTIVDGSTTPPELSGANKERGPINSNTTKVGVINTAPPPMLGDTNPNSNTDFNTVFAQSTKDSGAVPHTWYYFGWIRDADGTGFLALEFQHKKVSSSCIVPPTTTEPEKIDYTLPNCNPWANRQGGDGTDPLVKPDFLIMWDQSGNVADVIKRNFVCTGGAASCTGAQVILATCPSPLPTDTAQPCHKISTDDAITAFGQKTDRKGNVIDDTIRGELAIDLTDQVFGSALTCETLANIIPGSVTGNSDQADYKDVVLFPFKPVSNCGLVTVTKQTSPAGLPGDFIYKLYPTNGGAIFTSLANKDSDCDQTGSDVNTCVGKLTTSATHQTDTDTIENLLDHDTNWTLEETSFSGFTIHSITCTYKQETPVVLYANGAATGAKFKVVAGDTTECTIINDVIKNDVDSSTLQTATATITDKMTVTNIKDGASNAASAKATFELFGPYDQSTGGACATADRKLGPTDVTLTYELDGQGKKTGTATADLVTTTSVVIGKWYYWRVAYSGDLLNNPIAGTCGDEKGAVVFYTVP